MINSINRRLLACAGAAILLFAGSAQAVIVQKLSLEQMLDRADRVFRGVVTAAEPSSVSVGGGQLPVVVYTFEVGEFLKGSANGKASGTVTLSVLGSLKQQPARTDGLVRLSSLPEMPKFDTGGEYVLFTTAPSAVGLSTTVGLGQGAFVVGGRDMVVNALDNRGLFDGAVSYSELKAAIAAAGQ